MNNLQRTILFTISGVIVLMALFPPFIVEYSGGTIRNQGYHFIGNPPSMRATIHISVLLLQVLAAVTVATITFFATAGVTGRRERRTVPPAVLIVGILLLSAFSMTIPYIFDDTPKEKEVAGEQPTTSKLSKEEEFDRILYQRSGD